MSSKAPPKKKDDAAFDVEQQFIMRLPPVYLLLDILLLNTGSTLHCILGGFTGSNPSLRNYDKKFDQSKVNLITVTPRKPVTVYSVSYFCTKMHHLKAKITNFFPPRYRPSTTCLSVAPTLNPSSPANENPVYGPDCIYVVVLLRSASE